MTRRIVERLIVGDTEPASGQLHVSPTTPDSRGLVLTGTRKGTQTANVFEWYDTSDALKGYVNAAGMLSAAVFEVSILTSAATLSATSVYAGDMNTSTFSGGTCRTTNLSATTLSAGSIYAGAMNTSTLSATTASATTQYATTMSANSLYVGTWWNVVTLSATTLSATNAYAGAMYTSTFSGTSVSGDRMFSPSMSGGSIYAGAMYTGTLSGVSVSATTLSAGNAYAGSMSTSVLSATTGSADSMYVGELYTKNLSASGIIKAASLSATSMTATTISATNLTTTGLSAIGTFYTATMSAVGVSAGSMTASTIQVANLVGTVKLSATAIDVAKAGGRTEVSIDTIGTTDATKTTLGSWAFAAGETQVFDSMVLARCTVGDVGSAGAWNFKAAFTTDAVTLSAVLLTGNTFSGGAVGVEAIGSTVLTWSPSLGVKAPPGAGAGNTVLLTVIGSAGDTISWTAHTTRFVLAT